MLHAVSHLDASRCAPGTVVLVGPRDGTARVRRSPAAAVLRLAAALLLALVLAVLGTSWARADSLVVTEPQKHQELASAPGWVTLAFDGDVQPGSAKILVQDARGANVTVGELIVEGTNVTTQLEDGLARGTYTVRYRAATTDEPFGGAYQFSYGSGTFTSVPDSSWSGTEEEPAVLRNDDPNATEAAPPPSSRPRNTEPGVEVSKGTGASSTPTSSAPGPSGASSGAPTPTSTDAPSTAAPTDATSSPGTGSAPTAPGSGGSGPGTVAIVVGALAIAGGIAALAWWFVRVRARRPE